MRNDIKKMTLVNGKLDEQQLICFPIWWSELLKLNLNIEIFKMVSRSIISFEQSTSDMRDPFDGETVVNNNVKCDTNEIH